MREISDSAQLRWEEGEKVKKKMVAPIPPVYREPLKAWMQEMFGVKTEEAVVELCRLQKAHLATVIDHNHVVFALIYGRRRGVKGKMRAALKLDRRPDLEFKFLNTVLPRCAG